MQIMGYFKLSFIMTELDNLYTNLGAYSELSFIKEGVGVRSCGVLSQRVNQMLRVPNLDGDARRIHGDLSWFGQKKVLRPAGRREYCISLHLSACVGVTSCERGN
jgi:hypothetical protein